MAIRRSVLVVAVGILVALVSPLAAHAGPGGSRGGSGITCNLPESDAEALEGVEPYPPGEGPYEC